MCLNCASPLNMQSFSNSKYYSSTLSEVGWIRGCGIVNTEELRTQRANYVIHGLSIVQRVGTPNPTLFKGHLYVCVCIYVHTHTHTQSMYI